ncbi:hypothetical protein ALC60_14008, partial [Trachymyrmex zeteki]
SERYGQIVQYCYFKISITIILTREASSGSDLKVTLLAYQNNYVGIPSMMSNVAKCFDIPATRFASYERDNWYQEYRYPIKFKHSFPTRQRTAGSIAASRINRVLSFVRFVFGSKRISAIYSASKEDRNSDSGAVCAYAVTLGTIDTRREAKEIKRQGENTKTSGRRPERKTRPAIKSHQKFHFAITDAKSKQNHRRFVNYIFQGYFLLLNIILVRKWDYDYRSHSVGSSKFVIRS